MLDLAVYTTIYPGVESFLPDWFRSIKSQTDRRFRLWIGVDALSVETIKAAIGVDVDAVWVLGEGGDTPAAIRQRAFERIVDAHDAVVFVDSDDVLHPSRVAGARFALEESDLDACCLRIVDHRCNDLGAVLGLAPGSTIDQVLPRNNIFGLSNSSYRCEILRACLPIPPSVTIVDWFIATRAWQLGARLHFDHAIRMDYRQHGANMVRTMPPFCAAQVRDDTMRARQHFEFVKGADASGALAERTQLVLKVADDIEQFERNVVHVPEMLAKYVAALNQLEIEPLWWSCIAHPRLRYMWHQ